MTTLWIIIFLVFGFFLLVKSADVLVDGAAGLSKRYKVPKIIIGLTLVAFGTSAPETAVSILASVEKNAGIAVGNIIGSNIANIALIIGIMAFLKVIPLRQSTVTRGIPLNILAGLVMLILGFDVFFQNGSTVVNRFAFGDGLILLLMFTIFLYYVFADMKVAEVLEEEIEKKEKKYGRGQLATLIAMVVGGLAGLLVGGKLVVDNAVALASLLNVSQAVIGITIVAVGTSLPELVTSIVAIRKSENDLAVGNIVGSNAFNIFLVLGLASVINPIVMETKLITDAVIMIAITLMFFALTFKRKQLSRAHGFVFLACYLLYLVFLFVREIGYTVFPG
jgi:cation:H+ antiporter